MTNPNRIPIDGLLDFTQRTKHDYKTNWHHRVLCDYLDRFARKEIKRLMVCMPPRHGKSELVSRRLPAYLFGVNPDARIISCSYSADLAQRMNRDVQRIIDDGEYTAIFPGTRLYGKNIRTIADGSWLRNSDIFEIVNHAGVYRSAGVGGGIGGMGFDYGIIDDPIKNREEADSLRIRDRVWDWWQSTFYTRAEKDAAILLTTTRWHSDDMAGRILTSEDAGDWVRVSFPAIREDVDNADDIRNVGDPLWPDKYDLETLNKTHNVIGPYQWASLYQQRPRPREGGMFKFQWFKMCSAIPARASRVRWWDRASTEGAGDFTAGVLVAYDEGIFYVEDIVRGQWESGERDRIIRATAERDRALGYNVTYWGEQEPGSSGKDMARAFVRLLAGFTVYTEPTTGNKENACDPFRSQCQAGNVQVMTAPWTPAFINEACEFPSGRNDDQIESASRAANKLAESIGMGGFGVRYV
jgi:predicted phage terminase large subunit-like protein